MAYNTNCFINCPFDTPYERKLLKPIAFTVIAVGLNPHVCENPNDGPSRLESIIVAIKKSKFGIHDICRMELTRFGYPRFNMPFELGVDFGFKNCGKEKYKTKVIYIMDSNPQRHVTALSDLAGFDPIIHRDNPEKLVKGLRNFFYKTLNNPDLITGKKIWLDYQRSMSDILLHLNIEKKEFEGMLISEYSHYVKQWFRETLSN